MRLYVDLMSLSSAAGPSATARKLLINAGHLPTIEYVPRAARAETLGHLPLLVTDAGAVMSGLSEIIEWLNDAKPPR